MATAYKIEAQRTWLDDSRVQRALMAMRHDGEQPETVFTTYAITRDERLTFTGRNADLIRDIETQYARAALHAKDEGDRTAWDAHFATDPYADRPVPSNLLLARLADRVMYAAVTGEAF